VEQTQGSYADAARILGVHPNYLHRLIRNLELKEALKDALRDTPARGLSGFSGGNA
jgi:transposase-like protein